MSLIGVVVDNFKRLYRKQMQIFSNLKNLKSLGGRKEAFYSAVIRG